MPALERHLVENILLKNLDTYPIFIETGTLYGATVLSMENLFDELHTIEVNKTLYENVKNEYKGNKINFLLGDSLHILPSIVSDLEKNAVFFLDGHWSCGATTYGEKHVPLYEEIEGIIENFKHNAIIIIDDIRLFGLKTPVDWSLMKVETILTKVKSRLTNHYFLPSTLNSQDRLVLHIAHK